MNEQTSSFDFRLAALRREIDVGVEQASQNQFIDFNAETIISQNTDSGFPHSARDITADYFNESDSP
jgi:hypothetical protein